MSASYAFTEIDPHWQRHWDDMCFTVDEMRAKGWEANGRAGDPLFVAPDRGDYRPQDNSPELLESRRIALLELEARCALYPCV